jgi:hypothetical protein
MEDVQGPAAPFADVPAPRPRGSFLSGGIALAFALTLGVGALLGASSGAGPAQAAPGAPGGVAQRQLRTPLPTASGQCGGQVTVSRVTNRTITVTRSDGSTETIYVNSHTRYTRNGQSANLSAIVVGSKIYVVGTCGNHGRTINATSIQITG